MSYTVMFFVQLMCYSQVGSTNSVEVNYPQKIKKYNQCIDSNIKCISRIPLILREHKMATQCVFNPYRNLDV